MLRRYLETCVATAMREGRTGEIVDELMEALKFDKHTFRAAPSTGADGEATPAEMGLGADPVRAVARA
ncbi:hypothetical protein [Sporichthya sp.]|uniref:hypothetical protein n=1 Tax=Sporichthya sp. TaxID=65475 RepID=UPI001837F678|nr:hypothetical protein [Sporichthya sp.]MBA3743952.1 hypothetical protein [Sporichthya sp.]